MKNLRSRVKTLERRQKSNPPVCPLDKPPVIDYETEFTKFQQTLSGDDIAEWEASLYTSLECDDGSGYIAIDRFVALLNDRQLDLWADFLEQLNSVTEEHNDHKNDAR